MNHEVAMNIRRVRLDRNYTQEFVAFEIGVGQNTYSKYETGQIKITVDILCKLSAILNVSLSHLLDQTDTELYQIKHNNPYAEKLFDQLMASKNAEIETLKQCNEELTKVIQSLHVIINSDNHT